MKFPRTRTTDVFILNTRGGLKLNRFFLPGLSGLAQIFPAIVLRMKGYRVVGMQPLDLPSNWLLLHPGLREKVIESIYSRCNRIVNEFALKILGGEKKYKALLSLPFDIAIIPISLAYYFFGRFFLAKTLIATDACNNCEKCIVQCPVRAITMINDRPFWSYNCESCMRCVNNCPQRAIETTQTYSAILILISSMVISPLLVRMLEYIGVWDLFNRSAFTQNIWTLINSLIFILFAIICYRGLHLLMRFRLVNRIITYTSFSKYRFWRRYKAPKS